MYFCIMQDQLNDLPKHAKDKHKAHKNFFSKLKKNPPKKLDYLMQDLHEQEFMRTINPPPNNSPPDQSDGKATSEVNLRAVEPDSCSN